MYAFNKLLNDCRDSKEIGLNLTTIHAQLLDGSISPLGSTKQNSDIRDKFNYTQTKKCMLHECSAHMYLNSCPKVTTAPVHLSARQLKTISFLSISTAII